MTSKEDNDRENIEVSGSGSAANAGGVSAGEGGVAVGRDVHGPVIIARDSAQVTVTYQGTEVAVPSPEAIQHHRDALRKQLAADALRHWGGMSAYIQEEGATLPIQASPYQAGQLGPRENLIQKLHTANRLLVLGEPGTGKTVALERLAWELCSGPDPAIPVLIRLFQYDGASLSEWARSNLQRTGYLRLDGEQALNAFLQESEAHCIFLFDGLNEIALDYRDTLVGELVRWMSSYRRHPVILTSRSQDELWRRIRDDVGQAVVVQAISDEQAEDYLVAHLGERGESLYGQLDQRLQQLARTPLVLWLIKEAGAAGEDIPGNRGQLYARFVQRMLQRDTTRRIDAEIPVRLKTAALMDLAFHLGQSQKLSCSREDAVMLAAQRLGEDRADQVIGACARHGLLAGEDELWFAPHQTVQEHFAALALQALIEQEKRQEKSLTRWDRIRRRVLGPRRGDLAKLAADDWWMETFVQLAGLTEDADWLARRVARVNPWLAWWCVEEGGKVTAETREMVATSSVDTLESGRVRNRLWAVLVLATMRNDRAVEPLLRAGGDSDAEVAGAAVNGLGEFGEIVRPVVAESLAGTDHRLWKGSIRYLATRLDDPLCGEVPEQAWQQLTVLPMVWIPPGPFLMGSSDDDPDARGEEKPQHQVTLPGYWIGRYPVIVAQYRAFVEDSGYSPKDEDSFRNPDDWPITRVTWYDAIAYCRWLGMRSGLPVTLPSEAEWEKAARGTDGHRYPWGDQMPTAELGKVDLDVGNPTPVGQYSPQGDSPYGCADMAGNVWEWTRSLSKAYPYIPTDGREDLKAEANVKRVLRGGSWYLLLDWARCADRVRFDPDDRYDIFGFRIVVASTSSL